MRYRRTIQFALLAVALSLVPRSISTSQTTGEDLVNHVWKASWITHPGGPQREFGVFHFRKTITLDSVPQRFVIHVSGDNRYELFVNGQRVVALTAIRCAGPVVLVNGVPTTPPVVIKAIGDPDTLLNALNMRGGVLDMMRRFDPAMVKIDKVKLLHLQAYEGSTTMHYIHLPKLAHKEDTR